MNASVVAPLGSYGSLERTATVAYAATGRPPFGGGSPHGVCFRVLRGAVELNGVAEPVLAVLRLAPRRDPAERPSAAWPAPRLGACLPVMGVTPCSA